MQATVAPVLVLIEGQGVGRRWPLTRSPVSLGRDADNDIVLTGRQVSRHHALIRWTGKEFLVADLGSKNGTFVDGVPAGEGRPLPVGATLQIALSYAFSLVEPAGEPRLPESPSRLPPRAAERLRIDPERRQVWVQGREVQPPLSPAQFSLLSLLYSRTNQVVGREEIVDAVWGEEAAGGVSEEALDALVRRLRRRLSQVDPDHAYIVTVRGHGFRLQKRSV
ncbi:MAG: FHA domain-containing protein [Chloroflexi bacterium]|nr:FHA domain-containing protein [Chloroflexota bacterium]